MFWQPQADPKQLEPASSPRERQLRRSAEVVASQWAAGAPKSVGLPHGQGLLIATGLC